MASKYNYKIVEDPSYTYVKFQVYRNYPFFFGLFDDWVFQDSFKSIEEAREYINRVKLKPRDIEFIE